MNIKNVIFIVGVLLLFACGDTRVAESEIRIIKIDEYEYTDQQIWQYLHDVVESDKAGQKTPLFLWSNKDNRIGYSIVLTNDMDMDFYRENITGAMEYFSKLTGVEFYFVGKDLNKASMVIGVGTSFSAFSDNAYRIYKSLKNA